MKKLPFKLLLFFFSLFCPGFCSNRGNLGRVQPGVVEAAVSNGQSVLLGYLSTW